MKININKISSEFIWFCIGQVVTILSGVISLKIISNIEINQFAIYTLILGLAPLVYVFFLGPLEQALLKFYYSDFIKNYLNQKYLVKILLYSSPFVFLFCLTLVSFNLGIKINLYQKLLLSLFIFLTAANLFGSALLNIVRLRIQNSIVLIFEKLSFVISLLFLIQIKSLLFFEIIITAVLILSISLFLKIYFYYRDVFVTIQTASNDEYISIKLFSYGWPFLVWGIFSWMQTTSDRYIIAKILDLSQAAHFSLLLSVASFLVASPLSITFQFISPLIFKKYADSDFDGVKYIVKKYRLFNSILILILIFLTINWGSFLISILNDKFSSNANVYLPIFCFSTWLFQLSQFNTLKGQLFGRPSIYLIPKLISGILFPLISIFSAKYYGFSGFLFAMIFSNFLYFFFIYISNLFINEIF